MCREQELLVCVEPAVQVRPVERRHLRGVPEQPAHERSLVSVRPCRDGPHRHRRVRADESERTATRSGSTAGRVPVKTMSTEIRASKLP
jgi:hypothetical protein